MKINKELRALSEANLKKKLEELKKERFKLNSQRSAGTSPEKSGKLRDTKKTIARILTILNKKEKELVE